MWNLATFLITAVLASAGVAGVLTLIVGVLQREQKPAQTRGKYRGGVAASARN